MSYNLNTGGLNSSRGDAGYVTVFHNRPKTCKFFGSLLTLLFVAAAIVYVVCLVVLIVWLSAYVSSSAGTFIVVLIVGILVCLPFTACFLFISTINPVGILWVSMKRLLLGEDVDDLMGQKKGIIFSFRWLVIICLIGIVMCLIVFIWWLIYLTSAMCRHIPDNWNDSSSSGSTSHSEPKSYHPELCAMGFILTLVPVVLALLQLPFCGVTIFLSWHRYKLMRAHEFTLTSPRSAEEPNPMDNGL
eukprot:TRINITY_DN4776_c0_g1_i1.p1 TRINITY_DN4776_c0_g1~~TRINITY_DN4776_c0_g1_i1.p1  ORF type:complete len:245 (-),score=12.10 TRINITY_DN4776_c0_g1_i1:47-781(-)